MQGGIKDLRRLGWATLAVVMWSWGRATGGANATRNKGVSTAPLRPSQTTWYHSMTHTNSTIQARKKVGTYSRVLGTHEAATYGPQALSLRYSMPVVLPRTVSVNSTSMQP
jgi:hypothetical protein